MNNHRAAGLFAVAIVACSANHEKSGTLRRGEIVEASEGRALVLDLELFPARDAVCASKAGLVTFVARTSESVVGKPSLAWTDYVVRGHEPDARESCQRMVRVALQRANARENGLHTALLRPCTAAAGLPPEILRGAETLLVQPEVLGSRLQWIDRAPCTDVAEVTMQRFDSVHGCRRALALVRAESRAAAQESQVAVARFIQEERERQERQSKRRCAVASETRQRCAAMATPDVGVACTDANSDSCKAAKVAVWERDACTAELQLRDRACQASRSTLSAVLAREPSNPAPEGSRAFCYRSAHGKGRTIDAG